jgi:hypothetical protein
VFLPDQHVGAGDEAGDHGRAGPCGTRVISTMTWIMNALASRHFNLPLTNRSRGTARSAIWSPGTFPSAVKQRNQNRPCLTCRSP